jgi:hypothetical protein
MVRGMNLYLLELMDKPHHLPGHCVCCGASNPTKHHVVPRSQGGHKGPMLHLCGHGTAGHHGDAEHKRLHFRYRDGWQYLHTEPMKYEHALDLDGWVDC